jgi:hypothetical protein
MRAVLRYLHRNPSLALGIALLAAVVLFVAIGRLFVDVCPAIIGADAATTVASLPVRHRSTGP